ncbi:hypothetical protein [Caenimonas sp. SL110]|uniref:hypothetical protein n=1 Tax=Caenimonas sp. SL110 TaxID=1450524 RepID=UPI0006545094|nr:hypothetical protein [Caenimonas sp. SL110]
MAVWRLALGLGAAIAMGMALGGCATGKTQEAETVLIEHGVKSGVSIERTGLLFGSIGFVPRSETVSALSFHLRSLDNPGYRVEVFATNRATHGRWRTPDIDSESQRLWVFSGNLPVGRYEIALAAVSFVDARDIHWINFKDPIPVDVTTDGAVYVGRWQITPTDVAVVGTQLRVPGTPLLLRDSPDEDQALLARRLGISPIGKRAIVDALRDLMEQGRT